MANIYRGWSSDVVGTTGTGDSGMYGSMYDGGPRQRFSSIKSEKEKYLDALEARIIGEF